MHVKESWLWLAGVGLVLGLSVAISCGGSSSETPWPAEPIDLEPGPAGEEQTKGNVIDVTKLPDNYTKKHAGAPPATSAGPDAEPKDN